MRGAVWTVNPPRNICSVKAQNTLPVTERRESLIAACGNSVIDIIMFALLILAFISISCPTVEVSNTHVDEKSRQL